MAKKNIGDLLAPNNLTATPYPETESNPERICFSWDRVEGAVKYSLDVDMNGDGIG